MIYIMKSNIVVFSTLFCLFGVLPVNASECLGDNCFTQPLKIGKPAPLPVTLSINKNTEMASKPAWDGSTKKYSSPGFDKTVDWRDGVPIWDDSISNYKDTNFSDWFMQPQMPMYDIPNQAVYLPDVPDVQEPDLNSRKQVEDLLVPVRPADDLWSNKKYTAQDLSSTIKTVFESEVEDSNGCPFETESECDIWRKKPMVRETVSPRSPKILAEKMNKFIAAAAANNDIEANTEVAAPFLDRYKMLMKSAQACCTDGMAYELKHAGATEGLVYKFLSDDANFYGIGSRCLMMSDEDLDNKYPNTATAAVAADVRNGCLCRGRQWFVAMLAPFEEVYKASPEFADSKFNYKYTDGLQRQITVSVNTDVQNVLHQLSMCP